MYGDLVEWLENEIATCEDVKRVEPVTAMYMNPEIMAYQKVLSWIEERRSKSYIYKCQVEMEEAAKRKAEESKIGNFFKDKTQDEIMEIVRRNGGSK
ncbi:MAG: hypothetical protein ACRCX7_09925 [Cetobacterium sp.]|uniref:hypothetical protein n=1 Tax=Cetobacterium sp. TaxID=2071632 RepID=UPI003F2D4CC4